MANTKITTNVIADDAVTSDKLGGDLTMPGHVSLADNKELRIGTGNDLVIKHDGSHTTLTNTTGNFTFIGDQIYFANAANNEYLAQFIADGACSLRFNNIEELATVSGGVYIPNKLGVGDTTPQALLDVGGGYGANTTVATFAHATDAYIEIENITTQNGAGIILTNAGTKKWTIQKDTSAHSLHIQDTSGDVMTFLQGGDVGIGTTSPTSPNSVNTFLHIHNADHSSLVMSDDQNTWEIVSNNNLTVRDGTTTRVTVDTSGNIGIGASPAYGKLDIRQTGTGAQDRGLYLEVSPSSSGSNYNAALVSVGNANMTNTVMRIHHESPAANQKLLSLDTTGSNTEKFWVDEDGDAYLAGNLSFASGSGIDFANTSTQTGNTSVSHLFNDYEHGDFTPSLSHSNTCAVRTGRYVRVGDLVHFVIQIGNSMSDITSGNQFTVEGLPFPVYAANAAGSCFARYIDDPDNVVVYVTTNEALHLYRSGTGSWDSLYYSDLNSVSAYFYMHGSYRTT